MDLPTKTYMKKFFLLLCIIFSLFSARADSFYYHTPTNILSFMDDPSYFRIDYQWYLKNTGQNSPLYLNGKYVSQENGGGYDIGYEKAKRLYFPAITAKLGVIDTGVRTNHVDFQGIRFYGKNFILGQDANDLTDASGHGTSNGGIIFARNNYIGVRGILDVREMLICKTLLTRDYEIINAIYYCATNDVDIIHLPWGTPIANTALKNAILFARSYGCIIVCAAPNVNQNLDTRPDYPSSWMLDNVVSVTSCTREGVKYSPAAWGGSTVHIAAPGRVLVTTGLNRDYVYTSGTSSASAIVAAAMTVIASQYPDKPYQYWIERLLRGAVQNPSLSNTISGGNLNLFYSLMPEESNFPIQLPINVLDLEM